MTTFLAILLGMIGATCLIVIAASTAAIANHMARRNINDRNQKRAVRE